MFALYFGDVTWSRVNLTLVTSATSLGSVATNGLSNILMECWSTYPLLLPASASDLPTDKPHSYLRTLLE